VTILRIALKVLFSTVLILSAVLLLFTSTVGSQSLTTITSWTTATGQVTSTSYRTFAVATTSVTSMSTDTHNYTFTIPAQLARHCYYNYVNATFKAGDRVVGKVIVVSNTVDFYIMSKAQLLTFNHSPCDQEGTGYVKAIDIKSYVVDWVVPTDGEYNFIFSSYSPSMSKPQITGFFAVQYLHSQLVASTVYSQTGVTTVSANTRTLSSVYYSTVQNPLEGITSPSSLMIIGAVVGILVVVALVAISKRRKGTSTKPVETKGQKHFCINCGAELPANSKFCNKCGSAQT
jgi:hypothetical protein